MIRSPEGRTVARDPQADQGRVTRVLDVCLATPIFSPEYSGAAKRFERYAPGLLERGVRLRVLAAELGSWRHESRYEARSEDEQEADRLQAGVAVERVSMPAGASRRRVRWAYDAAIVRMCADPLTRPDVVITLSLLSGLHGLRLRRLGTPTIHVQTMFGVPARTGVIGALKDLSSLFRHRLPSRIVVSSDVMVADLRRRGISAPAEVIPHGVDLDRFRPGPDSPGSVAVRRKLGLRSGEEVILFVGPLHQRKGVDILTETWSNVANRRPQAHLVLVGPAPATSEGESDSFAAEIHSRLAAGPGANRVHFMGRVSNVESFMQAADLFVFPSRREGMPNVVCEAFAAGVATVLAPFLGLPGEFGRAGREYELVPHDAAEWTEAIVTLLSDRTRRARLGAAARSWAERHLDLHVSLDRYAGLCQDLAGASGTRF